MRATVPTVDQPGFLGQETVTSADCAGRRVEDDAAGRAPFRARCIDPTPRTTGIDGRRPGTALRPTRRKRAAASFDDLSMIVAYPATLGSKTDISLVITDKAVEMRNAVRRALGGATLTELPGSLREHHLRGNAVEVMRTDHVGHPRALVARTDNFGVGHSAPGRAACPPSNGPRIMCR